MLKTRNIVGASLLVTWTLIFAINLGLIDKIGVNLWSKVILKSGYYIFPLLLLVFALPFWIRALAGLGSCLVIAIIAMMLSPKVPYDAPASIWMMMFFLAYSAIILSVFAFYALIEFIVKGMYKESSSKPARDIGRVTFFVFIALALCISLIVPISRKVIFNKATNIVRGDGHTLDMTYYKLDVPSFFVSDYAQSTIEIAGRKAYRQTAKGMDLPIQLTP